MDLNLTDSSLKKKYIYADRQIIAQHDGEMSDDKYFYLHDRLGSVRLVLAANGDVAQYYTYEPFGEVIDANGTFENAFRFTGQYFDAEIQEYYLRARQYNPGLARFTARDPVRGEYTEPLTLHKYLYCLNDPVDRIDPSGKFSLSELKVTISTWGTAMSAGVAKFGARAMGFAGKLLQGAQNYWIRLNLFAADLGCWCFTGDTEISTPNGNIPIADIRPGDFVWAYDEATGKPTRCRVARLFENRTDCLLILRLHGRVIRTTREHPFWVKGRGWVEAGDLREGDEFLTLKGKYVTLDSISLVKTNATVYNIEVEKAHTFFVSPEEILVHNKPNVNVPGRGASGKQVLRFLKSQGFEVVRTKGSHQILKGPLGRTVTVPLHGAKSLAIGTLNSILRQAGFR
ncbi:MAG: type II toxin-antitoxin system HicA family toxin [Phycisphaerae bacterium]|nr:type II toxin-antitoxin system HicA family toxin [Phycisphaerae bacterium]